MQRLLRTITLVVLIIGAMTDSHAALDKLEQEKKLIAAKKYAEAISLLEGIQPTTTQVSYQRARAMAYYRETNPCDAMFEVVLENLKLALERSRRLRTRARRDPAFRAFRGTCAFQRLALGLDPRKAANLRQLLLRVNWQGTNCGTNQPGPQDMIGFSERGGTLQAMRVCGGAEITGSYSLKKNRISIKGECQQKPGKARKINLELTFEPETCTLNHKGEHLFDDEPDECNT